MKSLLSLGLAILLVACSSGPPIPDWQMNAQSSIERFKSAYMDGNVPLETEEFGRARDQIARSGKIELLIRAELLRCAMRVASLAFDTCTGFERLQQDAAAPDFAYARYLNGRIELRDVALLPAWHRAVATAGSNAAISAALEGMTDPLSKLVAAGALLRAGRASPALLAIAVDTASAQGWRRPLLAWLGVQALRASQAGDLVEAERIRRRIDLVQRSDGASARPGGRDQPTRPIP